MNKFKIGDMVWFLKSMRMCEVVEIHTNGYTVERVDSRKKLFATETGLDYVDTVEQTNTGDRR